MFKITGKIISISPPKDVKNEAKIVDLVVQTDEQYNNIYPLQKFYKKEQLEHLEKLTKYNNVGDTVEVEFKVNANLYEGRYFTSLALWSINRISQGSNFASTFGDDDDDLPF